MTASIAHVGVVKCKNSFVVEAPVADLPMWRPKCRASINCPSGCVAVTSANLKEQRLLEPDLDDLHPHTALYALCPLKDRDLHELGKKIAAAGLLDAE